MGTQNGSNHDQAGFLIFAFSLEIMKYVYFPYVCIGSHSFAMFAAHAYVNDDPLTNMLKLYCMAP